MPIAHRLASALRRKDQMPNNELAIELTEREDEEAIHEVAELMSTGTKAQRHDALKVLYEIGFQKPGLITPHIELLFDELDATDNRTLWGAMMALRTQASTRPKRLMQSLDQLMDAAERSSVIAKDNMVKILVALGSADKFYARVAPLLLKMIETAAINQFPTYAERAATVLKPSEHAHLIALIEARRFLTKHTAKKKRMEKLLRRLRT